MLIYKFYPPEYALQSLLKCRFKVSPIDELNDPFEYLSLDMGDKRVRPFAKDFRNTIARNNGIISFSKNWNEPLMWAHYAKSHTGIALGFEVTDKFLTHMNYITDRITPPPDVDTNKESMRTLERLIYESKHKNWQYEEEARLIRRLQDCDKEDGLYFTKWNHNTVLKEVVLGDRYISEGDTVFQSCLEDLGVKFITARPEFKGFKMTPQINQKLHKKL
jgi:hypothetical protein